jgi:hypothetical protein
MVYFQTENPNLGTFWRVLAWQMLLYFTIIWNIFMAILHNLWQFGIVCGHLVYLFPFWYVWTKKHLAATVQSGSKPFSNHCAL